MELSSRTELTTGFTDDDIFHLVSAGASWKVKTSVFFTNGLERDTLGIGLGGTLRKDTSIYTDSFRFQLAKAANTRLIYNNSDEGDLVLLSDQNQELYFNISTTSSGATAQSALRVTNNASNGVVLLATSTGNTNRAYLQFAGLDSEVLRSDNKSLYFKTATYNTGVMYNDKFGIGTFAAPSSDIYSNFHLKGTLSIDKTTRGTNTNFALTNDHYYYNDTVSADRTITLPSISTVGAGKVFVIRNYYDSSANMIVTCPANHAFDIEPGGATTFTLLPGETITISAIGYSAPSGVYSIMSGHLAGAAHSTTTIGINGDVQTLAASRNYATGYGDTGVLSFVGGITVAGSSTINIGEVYARITNNESNPLIPTYTDVHYPATNNVIVTTVGTGLASYVMLDTTGAITFQNTFPTDAERIGKVYLGKVGHPAGIITTGRAEPDIIISPLSSLRALMQTFNYVNSGVAASGNAGLTFNTSAGKVVGLGVNSATLTSKDTLSVAATAPCTFLPRTETGAGGAATTAVDVANYSVGGVITAIPGGAGVAVLKYIFLVPALGFIVQYGQVTYANLTDAVAAVGREAFTIYPSLERNSVLIGVIAHTKSATNLNNTVEARFFRADIFGQLIGATSGVSVGTMQTAYNNSAIPQVTVTDTLGAMTWRSGRASNTSAVSQWQNIAGTTTASIDGNGLATLTNATISSMTLGSVLFAGTGGAVSQENGKFFYSPTGYNSNAHLLINATAGTPTAGATFQVRGSGTGSNFTARFENSGASNIMQLRDDGVILFGSSSSAPFMYTANGVAGGNAISGTTLGWSRNNSVGVGLSYNFVDNITSTTSATTTLNVTGTLSASSTSNSYTGLGTLVTITTGVGYTGTTYGYRSTVNPVTVYNHKAFSFETIVNTLTPNAAITDYQFGNITPVINASVNNQIIVGLDITMSGSDGAFTGVMRRALRLQGGAALLAAGTTTYAPLVFVSGTNRTTPVNGGMEYNGTNLFFTRTGAVREGVLTQSAVTTEALTSDTSVTVNINGTTYKLLAKA